MPAWKSSLATALSALGGLLTDVEIGLNTTLHTALKGHITPEKHEIDTKLDFLNEKMYDGMVHVGEKGGEMFYVLFEAREDAKNAPLVMWLTGGPGCSSEFAWVFENGPFTMQDDATLKKNQYSWNSKANMLYVDQPLGTGFSETNNPRNYVRNEMQISKDVGEFLARFVKLYPEYYKRDFFITGESYAGHYIPSIAQFLDSNPVDGINLKGIAIGNGWVNPYLQYPQYAEYAKDNDVIDEQQYEGVKAVLKKCDDLIQAKQFVVAFAICGLATTSIIKGRNPYDIRLGCPQPPLCYNTTAADSFFNNDTIQKDLLVEQKWEACNMLVHTALLGDWMLDEDSKMQQLLDGDYKVLVYSGDKDFICNWYGGDAWTADQEWKNKENFNKQDPVEWPSKEKSMGQLKSYKNFAFLRVYDAGHMVPMDQPENAYQMFNSFIGKGEEAFPGHDDIVQSELLEIAGSRSEGASQDARFRATPKDRD